MARSWSARDAWKLNILDVVARPFVRPNAAPLWVFGIQKAGTSVFARALAEATGRTHLLDTPVLWDTWTEEMTEQRLGQILKRHPLTFSPEIIKEPTLTFYPDAALQNTTRKRHVLLIRDPAQNIRSHLDRMGIAGNAQIGPQSGIRPAYVEYFNSSGLPPAIAMAHRWLKAHAHERWFDDAIAVLEYERFVQDPNGQISAATRHLGWTAPHSVASVMWHQHQPAGANRNQDLETFFGTDILSEIRELTEERYTNLRARALRVIHT